MKPSDFSVEQDRALLSFIIDNASSYDRYEIFLQAQKESILAQKTILDLYLRYHRFLFPLFTGKPSNESASFTNESFSPEEDRALLTFILDNSSKFDRWEIFLQAQKEEVLQNKTILQLYLRYHRYLFPLFTGKPSDESVQLESFPCVDDNGSKLSSTENCYSESKYTSLDLESETSDYGSANSSRDNSASSYIPKNATFSNMQTIFM